jgi:hypothetical protein
VTCVLEQEQLVQGTTFNLSRGGCAIECEVPAVTGETVSLQITVPTRERVVSVELGRICWATQHEFGVEFRIVPTDSKKVLDEYLVEVARRESA